jgi:hypothetical protein
MTKKLSRAELDALAADTITKQTAYIDRLEHLVKRAGGEAILNDDRAELAKAPSVAKAIETALANVKGAKSVPGLFAEAHVEVRKETIAGKNAASRSLDREIHDGANNVAKQTAVGSKIRRDIRRDYR